MSLTYPFRIQIQRNIISLLETITPTNGYVNDLSPTPVKRIFRGRAMFGDDDPIPMVSLIEPPVPTDQVESQVDNPESTGDYLLIAQGWVNDDFDNPTDPANILLADVRKCFAAHRRTNKYTLLGLGSTSPDTKGTGNAVTKLGVGLGIVRPPDQISVHAYFWLILSLTIAENLEKPYG